MTNKELSQIANMELRDQLEAKEQMIKSLNELVDSQQQTNEALVKKLEIAVTALKSYENPDNWMRYSCKDKCFRYWRTIEQGWTDAHTALKKMGVKK